MNAIPGPFIKLVINTLMWMDKHSIMPKFIIDLSPFHTSLFLTNLKSLGINHVFHHVYNFGTTLLLTGAEDSYRFFYYTFLLVPVLLIILFKKINDGGVDEIVPSKL